MEKLKQIVAFVLKMSDGDTLNEGDFVNVLSLKKNWIDPEGAKKLFRVCVDAGVLVEEEGGYKPSFKISGIIIPLDFSVSEEDIKRYSLTKDVFDEILDTIVANGYDRGEAVMEINGIKNELNYITIEVAALVFCKEKGIDCSKFYRKVEEKIKSSE
jgi:hypothetical protein